MESSQFFGRWKRRPSVLGQRKRQSIQTAVDDTANDIMRKRQSAERAAVDPANTMMGPYMSWRSVSQGSKEGTSSPSRPSIHSAGSYRDSGETMGTALDSRQVLKAYRYVGGFKGVELEDLRDKVARIRNAQVRTALLKDLDHIFARHDGDGNGNLDVIEFERMVNSSTLLQSAVYEFLQTCHTNEFDGFEREDLEICAEYVEVAAIGLIFLHLVIASIAIDNSPGWEGWQWIEFVFVCLFSVDVVAKYKTHIPSRTTAPSPWRAFMGTAARELTRDKSSIVLGDSPAIFDGISEKIQEVSELIGHTPGTNRRFFRRLYQFLSRPANFFDVLATISGWVEACVFFIELAGDKERNMEDLFWSLRRLRIIRFLRLLRVVHVIFFFGDLRSIFAGVVSGMRSVFFGFAFITLVVFLWTVFIRHSVVSRWVNDHDGTMKETFPNMHESMLVVVRCMVIGTDGSCMTSRSESVVVLLSREFGWFFDSAWILTQAVLLFGVLNVIAAIFVLQLSEHALDIRDSIFCARSEADEMRLNSLDHLLRTLIYPGRALFDPKAKYADEVSRMIQRDHPEAAQKIPDLRSQVVEFAKGIQESKNMLQNAMSTYEAQEVEQCKMLKNTPSARIYVLDGKERLYVPQDEASMSNSMGIPPVPDEAVEVLLLQESSDLPDLLQEGQAVQNYVKSLILPDSAWAVQQRAGVIENVWKQSKGFCDEAVDPGPKDIDRVKQKVFLKYDHNFQRNRDYCRLGLIYHSVDHLMSALPKFLALQFETDGLEVVSIENRFLNPHQLGWRDITVLFRVRVPSTRRKHIMEIQMQLYGLKECRGDNHKIYEQIRSVLPDDVLNKILDRLVTDTTLDLGITKEEWTRCIRNKQVKLLLDGLGVPATCRQRIFDLVDIDGSGTVTSSELQEILRLFRTPAQSLELAGLHLRVRDVQRYAQTKVGPQLNKMHKMQKVIAQDAILRQKKELGVRRTQLSSWYPLAVNGSKAFTRDSSQASGALSSSGLCSRSGGTSMMVKADYHLRPPPHMEVLRMSCGSLSPRDSELPHTPRSPDTADSPPSPDAFRQFDIREWPISVRDTMRESRTVISKKASCPNPVVFVSTPRPQSHTDEDPCSIEPMVGEAMVTQ